MELKFNLVGLEPQLSRDGVLTIQIPVQPFNGPLVTKQIREQMIHCGLKPLEVDFLIDSWYEEFQDKAVMAHLGQRRVRFEKE